MSVTKPASIFSAEVLPELDSWATTCESPSAEDLLDPNDPQLDEFCRYIESCGDEEFDLPSPTPISSPSPERPAPHCQRLFDATPPQYPPRFFFPECPHPWKIELENEELWREFDRVGTEMVITKNGRHMFPSLSVLVSGLDPEDSYSIHLDIVPANNKRYKFLQTEWVTVGRADKKQTHRQYVHPDSPSPGSYWMSKPVNFKLVKLTNNKATKCEDQVILNTMQRYQPCFVLTRDKDKASQTFFFPESQFIAVTAYQNSKITQLKIDHNPYARAFRECIPSEGSALERKGGQFSKRKSSSPSPSPPSNKESRQSGGKSKPLSFFSGFESGEGSCESMFLTAPPPIYPDTQILSQNNLYSLYNPALITSPPMLDSFSEPYLSQMAMEMSETVISPVKDLDYI